jgi:phosphoenolpyruvate---glycerone phosphotransferase subunit DhaM
VTDRRALVGIVVVSHSARLADGVVELARQMAGPDLALIGVGGAPDGGLGTDADRIARAIRDADRGAGVLVLGDLGSAMLATATALEMIDDPVADRVRISSGPIAEGAVVAAVQASIGQSLDEVLAAADGARDLDKGVGR